jgi:hypothetical protein
MKTFLKGITVALTVVAVVNLLPDFVRYMKIRAM